MLKHTRAIKSHFTYGVADLIKCLSLRHINILTLATVVHLLKIYMTSRHFQVLGIIL